MKVIATNEFKKIGLPPKELDHVPEAGEIFEVTEERARVLEGANCHKRKFIERVQEVETAKSEVETEKAVKKTTRKTTTKKAK